MKPNIANRRTSPTHRSAAAQMLLAALLAFAGAPNDIHAQGVKSFPQAEGFGAEATGGRGGIVYHVTSLGDSNSPGTLRYGLTSLSSSVPVTIVFDVGGWINLNENLGVTRSNVTIAGQTAPGGIGVRNRKFSIGGDDIVVRHVQFAYGNTPAAANDTVNVNNNSQDVIFDHVAAVLARDENFSAQSTNLTLQWSTVSYGLQSHSAGSLLEEPTNLSFHHNLWAHNHTRNPKARVQGAFDYINNVVYDYGIGFIAGDSGTTDYFWPNNFDGNYFVTGPNDSGNPMIVDGHSWNTGLYFGTNAYDGDGDSQHDGVVFTGDDRGLSTVVRGSYTRVDQPYSVTDPIWQDATPEAAYQRVLAEFGPNPQARNDFLQLLASNVANRSGSQISNQSQLPVSNGGWGTIGGGASVADSDGDGISDEWEEKHDLPVDVASNNGDFDNDGFTNLEEYLNDLAAFKATGPIELIASGRYAEWSNWTRRWEPSRVDDVHINDGTATVDAVGQRAGSLQVGAAETGAPTLAVAGGWLEVTDNLTIGGGVAGDVAQTGGVVRILNGGVAINSGEYRLSGGALRTPLLTKEAGGALILDGGELHADVVSFDLLNSGGVVSPGESIGQTHVLGDADFTAGTLHIELASADDFDRLVVDGLTTLGGALEVSTLGNFAPESGRWEIISAAGFSGSFSAVSNGYAVEHEGGSLFLVVAGDTIAGDYNQDGVVDTVDYAVWRENLGQTVPPGTGGDGNNDGVVGSLDFEVWRANFGVSAPGPSSTAPEIPTGVAGTIAALITALSTHRRGADQRLAQSHRSLRAFSEEFEP